MIYVGWLVLLNVLRRVGRRGTGIGVPVRRFVFGILREKGVNKMKQNLSPAIVAVAIVLVVGVAGVLLYRATGPRGKVHMTPDQIKQMQQAMGQHPSGNRMAEQPGTSPGR